jgi:hypothetical protein
MNTSYHERTGHLIANWGVPEKIYERKPIAGKKIAVIEFAPKRSAGYWRYVTNGMSEHLQPASEGGVRTELVAYAGAEREWIVDLLDALSRYPLQHGTYFSEYDTIAVGQPIDRRSSPFQGVLLAPLPLTEQRGAGTLGGIFPETVTLLQVVGLHESEMDAAVERGGEFLFDLLERNEPVVVDADRAAVGAPNVLPPTDGK